MLVLFGILIILTSVILGFIILVQNPKGGGLSGTIGGFSNQLIGVRQSTDIMEKGTWIFAGVIAFLCIASTAFIPKEGEDGGKSMIDDVAIPKTTNTPMAAPAPDANTTTLGDSAQ
jgi:preprotein translocase subunit SecG